MNKCQCGNVAMHTTYQYGEHRYECCECYVRSGAAPASWHPECMATFRHMEPEKYAAAVIQEAGLLAMINQTSDGE